MTGVNRAKLLLLGIRRIEFLRANVLRGRDTQKDAEDHEYRFHSIHRHSLYSNNIHMYMCSVDSGLKIPKFNFTFSVLIRAWIRSSCWFCSRQLHVFLFVLQAVHLNYDGFVIYDSLSMSSCRRHPFFLLVLSSSNERSITYNYFRSLCETTTLIYTIIMNITICYI